MRLYIEDCFNDELQNGLILLGKHGRIWSDQPGGRKNFAEGINGITYHEDERFGDFLTGRVFYGITRGEEDYPEHPNAYPCNDETDFPEFCLYKFPDTSYSFGKLNLLTSTLTADLKRFLINRTVDCVHRFVYANISGQAEIESSPMELDLVLRDEGISVRAEYPLKFRLGGQEFFQLSEFDFFYPTKFKQLLDAAVAFPLQWDHRFADFDYSEEVLLSPFFIYNSTIEGGNCREGNKDNYFCERSLYFNKYQELSIQMTKEELGEGNDLFIFRTPFPNVLQIPQDYEFRIARQNRAPALSYVNRSACPELGYDYLVIKDEPNLGAIGIELTAAEPDEDEVSFDFPDAIRGEIFGQVFPRGEAEVSDNSRKLEMSKENVVRHVPANGIYSLTAVARDGHGLEDWQTVRLLVERSLETASLVIDMPYQFRNGATYAQTGSPELGYRVSREDPFFVKITLPEPSVTGQDAEVKMSYTLTSTGQQMVEEDMVASYNGGEREYCFTYPRGTDLREDCEEGIERYTSANFEEWNTFAADNPFIENGLLKVDFSLAYCQAEQNIPGLETEIVVEECIPHYNPEHRYPYILGADDYYKTKFENNQPTGISEDINPFLATHTCCNSNWELKERGEDNCFDGHLVPFEEGCFGGLDISSKNYLLEKRYVKAGCTGERGNLCEFKGFESYQSMGVCGNPNANNYGQNGDCNRVHPDCAGSEPGSITGGVWCWGTMGCQKACITQVVDITNIGLDEQTIKENIEQYNCGCSGNTGQPCLNVGGSRGTCQGVNRCR